MSLKKKEEKKGEKSKKKSSHFFFKKKKKRRREKNNEKGLNLSERSQDVVCLSLCYGNKNQFVTT